MPVPRRYAQKAHPGTPDSAADLERTKPTQPTIMDGNAGPASIWTEPVNAWWHMTFVCELGFVPHSEAPKEGLERGKACAEEHAQLKVPCMAKPLDIVIDNVWADAAESIFLGDSTSGTPRSELENHTAPVIRVPKLLYKQKRDIIIGP
ncbi:hypothetical protein GN244_ATG18501 [Phytophthora infestans]|uniref:Uncharacterized protein n=1 Tax=Phytophthora infestans TaxID=4787 RepID=A0A833WDN0_PHYIN|nr:hypothetical protein GN244_ATG18501 [Phytophthora infestans]KAF4150477.1 hypothetical protein GN958_ATG00349 [Phytophthora infestans]